MENGNWALIDLSDARLGHPLKILRALSDLSPKTHYPWPGQDDPLGCERAAVLLLLGLVPYPNFEPPFYLLARDLAFRVIFFSFIKKIPVFRKIPVSFLNLKTSLL